MSRITLLFLVAALPAVAAPVRGKSEILKVVKAAEKDIVGCGDDLHGEVVKVKWVIGEDGFVRNVKVLGAHENDSVGTCMEIEVKNLRFAPADKSTPISFPFKMSGRSMARQGSSGSKAVIAGDKPASTKTVQAKTSKLTGKLDKTTLNGLLTILEDDLKRCGSGTVQTRFTIRPTGKVGNLKIASADDDKVETCVHKRIARVRFPAPDKPTQVQRAFSLDNEG